MDPITLLFIGSLLSTIVGGAVSAVNNERALSEQKELQEDAQDFTHEERVEQNQYQQQMHEFNLVNDPILQKKGMISAGVSEAAAAQAIAGAPSVGYSPTASNGTSGIASVPNLNAGFQPFANIADVINSYMENKEKQSNIDVNSSQVKVNQQSIDESIRRMEKMANDMNIDNAQLDIAKTIANSQVDLNESQIRVNLRTLDRIDSEIKMNLSKVENLDADTVLKYVEASKVVAETENIQMDTTLKGAQVEYTNAQTELVGAQTNNAILEGLDRNLVIQMKQFRIEVSKALGFDVDAPEVTQLVEAMAMGRYDSVAKLLDAIDADKSGIIPDALRIAKRGQYGGYRISSPDKSNNQFSPSFISTWHPNNYQKGKSFRW